MQGAVTSCVRVLMQDDLPGGEGSWGRHRAVLSPGRMRAAPAILLIHLSFTEGWDLDAVHLSSVTLCKVIQHVRLSFPICK